MIDSVKFCFFVFLAVLTTTTTIVTGFSSVAPGRMRQRATIKNTFDGSALRSQLYHDSSDCSDCEIRPSTRVMKAKKHVSALFWRRTNTLQAAGLVPQHQGLTANQFNNDSMIVKYASATPAIGFFGHSGIFLLSTILVKTAMKYVKTKTDDDNSPPKGIMDRCPWPFIFFHDPRQALKDSPTWVVVLWIILWRGWKYILSAKQAGL